MQLKPLRDQVVAITGASSGIGRETALRFAQAGARLVVAARGEAGLRSLVDEVSGRGGQAIMVRCDVADYAQVQRVAEAALLRFGRIDTWVNAAAVSVYACAEDTTPDEFRRVTEVNYLGQVHGALAALPYLRRQGGALIAISSVESIVGLPLHSAYTASKHAVEGFVDALRRELMAEGAPVSVTSVKPGTINTPLFTNSRTKMDVKPQGPPPYYHPGVVADCILYAAEHPVRDLFAGGAAKMMATAQMLAPGLVDRQLARSGISSQRTGEPRPPRQRDGNLYEPLNESRTEGDFSDRAHRVSPYTWLETHPAARALTLGTVLAGVGLLLWRRADGAGRSGDAAARSRRGAPTPLTETSVRDGGMEGGIGAYRGPSISTGTNARARNETISSSAPGLPDDTSHPVEITPEEEQRIEARIRAM